MGNIKYNVASATILNDKEEKFCMLFLKYGNAPKAFIEAFPEKAKWKQNSISCESSKLLKKPKIQQKIEQIKELKNHALAKSLSLNKRKLIETALKALNDTNTPAERQHFVNILKLLFNKEGLNNEGGQIQVNINNAPIINEITNYLDI